MIFAIAAIAWWIVACAVAIPVGRMFAKPAERLLDHDFTAEHLDDGEWPECKVIQLRPRVRVEVYDDAA